MLLHPSLKGQESRYTGEIEVRFEVLDTVKNPFATKARS